jgi:hypothetical protein
MRKVSILLSPTFLLAVILSVALLACLTAQPTHQQTAEYRTAAVEQLEFTQTPTTQDNLVYTRADTTLDWRQDPAKLYEVTFVSFVLPAVYMAILVAARPLE